MPSNVTCTVKKVALDGEAVEAAIAGDSAELILTDIEPTFVNAGGVLSSPRNIAPVVRRVRARVTTLPSLRVPIVPGRQFTLHGHAALGVPAHVTKLVRLGTKKAGEAAGAKPKRPRAIGRRKTAVVEIEVGADSSRGAICADTFANNRSLGRFLLRERGVTVAAGAILKVLE